MPHPSGDQWEIRHGDQVAVVVEVGGGLRTYEAGGGPVLDGYPVGEMCNGGRGQVLVPWPNRLAGGRYEFRGRKLQLPINEVSRHNAIHGLVRWASWHAVSHDVDRVRVGHVLLPQPGYPFTLGVEVEYSLAGDGLTVTVDATNLGDGALPYATGHHPYITVGEPAIDSAQLRVPASRALVLNDQRIPVGVVDVASAGVDFRSSRTIGEAVLDVGLTALDRDAQGRAWVEMCAGRGDRVVRVWMDASYTHVMLFSGDTLEDASRRRCGLAIEPMTCAPNAFAAGEGYATIEPGATHSTSWGIALS